MVLGAMLVYCIILSATCHVKYVTFGYDDFDLAVHAQSMWNMTHGSLDCSILNIPFLGNHMVLILFFLAPLYAVLPSPLLLLYVQTLVVAAGAWGVYLMARKELSPRWGAGLAVAYLVYPPLVYMNLYEFHPIVFATTFLIYAMYAFRSDRFRLFLVFLGLAMLCQENVSLIAACFGIYALACRKPRRWAIVPAVAGIGYFVLTVCMVMPMLNRNTVQFLRIYSHFGDSPFGIAKHLVLHPVQVIKFCLHPLKLNFLNSLLAPLGYVSLAGPLAFIPALPALAQRLLSGRVSEAVLIYHYQAELIPFVFAAAVSGVRNLRRIEHRIMRLGLVALLAFFPLAALFMTDIIPRVAGDLAAARERPFVARTADAALERIPDDASVVATFQFLPRLSGRRELRSLHHIYWGKHTLSDVPFPSPDNVDYLVIDTNDRVTFLGEAFYTVNGYRNIQGILGDARWETVTQLDSFLVLRRAADQTGPPPGPVRTVTEDVALNTNFTATAGEAIELTGFAAGEPDADNNLPLTLYWRKPEASDRDYHMYVTVSRRPRSGGDAQPYQRTGRAGPPGRPPALFSGMLSPGSRIWPPQSWEAGTTTADRHRIHLKHSISPDAIHVAVKLMRRH